MKYLKQNVISKMENKHF